MAQEIKIDGSFKNQIRQNNIHKKEILRQNCRSSYKNTRRSQKHLAHGTACSSSSPISRLHYGEKKNTFHVCDTSRPSVHQRLSMPQSFHGECDYSSCDRDLVLAVNQHQSFPDRQRARGNTVTQGEVLYVAIQSKEDKALR